LSYTVGAAFYPEHGKDFRALMRMADKNMLENKGRGTTTRHMLN
jgi:GGDEF domain-containing protein